MTTATRGLTWQEIIEAARVDLPATDIAAEGVVLRWVFSRDREEITQEVRARPRDAFGETWVELAAPIGAAVDCRAALERGAETCIGTLVIEDGSYVVRHVASLASLTWSELRRAFEWVAREAVALTLWHPTAPEAQMTELFHGFV